MCENKEIFIMKSVASYYNMIIKSGTLYKNNLNKVN